MPLLVPTDALDPVNPGCTTVAVLGATTTSFALDVHPPGASVAQSADLPVASLAGAAEITRCGAERPLLSRLALEMRSPRAVVRIVVLRSSKRAPSLVHALPHRDPGPFAPLIRSGPRPALAPLAQRIAAFEDRATLAGAVESGRLELTADEDGGGSALMHLDEGCHELSVLSGSAPGGTPDVDADVVAESTGEILASDHSDASDATLSLCLGATTALRVRFAGAASSSSLALLHAHYALPSGLPEHWGPPARGHMAEALHARDLRNLGIGPVYESLGVQGETLLPIPVEPGACYVIGVALIRGQADSLGLSADWDNRTGETQAAPGEVATALALCAQDDHVGVRVALRGAGAAWVLAAWRTSRARLGGESP